MSSGVKISVLVPIFNVEEYLAECLDSLVGQTLSEIEIICINDGSTDSSLEIVKKYAERDERIVIIDKINTGYGDSMNRGLDRATGEYVGIVEPDDYIELDAFEKMYKIAKKNHLDVVKANFYEYMTKKGRDVSKSSMFLPEEENVVINPREHRQIFYQQPSIWSAIYDREFLVKNEIRFLPSPGASYQDAGFNFKVWAAASRVQFMSVAFLHYRQDNPNSSVKSDGKVYAVKEEYDEVERWLKERNLYEEYSGTLAGMRFSSYIWNLRRLTRKSARRFAKAVKADYRRLKTEGVLGEGKLDAVSRHNAEQLPIRHPNTYISTRSLYDARDKTKRAVVRGMKMTLPKYKQRAVTIDLLDELAEMQEELASKIERLEKDMGEKTNEK